MSLKKDLNKCYFIDMNDINNIDSCFIRDNDNKRAKRCVTLLHTYDKYAENFKHIFITHGENYCDNKDFEKNIIALCLKYCDPINLKFDRVVGYFPLRKIYIVINNIYIMLRIYRSRNKYIVDLWDCTYRKYITNITLNKDEIPSHIEYLFYNL